MMERHFDVLACWRERSTVEVTGKAIDCGHFLAEEKPDATTAELLAFFSDGQSAS
jgi:haloacetate dehalogenase